MHIWTVVGQYITAQQHRQGETGTANTDAEEHELLKGCDTEKVKMHSAAQLLDWATHGLAIHVTWHSFNLLTGREPQVTLNAICISTGPRKANSQVVRKSKNMR